MNEETIFDQTSPKGSAQQKKTEKKQESPVGKQQSANENTKSEKRQTISKSAKSTSWGAAGIAGAAGLAAGILTPLQVFPGESNESAEANTDMNTPSSEHLVGHEIDVATSVDDSMTFDEAFAAAREEVGAGGLFVWHGHTYGTYYANEWNSMSPEDKEQYWADVHHTTTHINDQMSETASNESAPEVPITGEPYVEPSDLDEPVDTQIPENPPEGWDGNGETIEPEGSIESVLIENPNNSIDENGTLHLTEDQVNGAFDINMDGITDGVEVEVNSDDTPDIVLDTDGDGSLDTLLIDPDENWDTDQEYNINDMQVDNATEMLNESETAPLVNEDCPDIDVLADNSLDNGISIDNDMDMGEYV